MLPRPVLTLALLLGAGWPAAASAAPAKVTIYPGTGGIRSLQCSTTERCTAVNGEGTPLTFRTSAPAKAVFVSTDRPEWRAHGDAGSLSCPSVSLCVSFGSLHGQVSFDPRERSPALRTARFGDDGHTVNGTCPAVTLCVAQRNSRFTSAPTEVFTFDPRTFAVGPNRAPIDDGWLACPSATQCTSVGAEASPQGVLTAVALTFNPAAPAQQTRVELGTMNPQGLTCPSTGQCTILGTVGPGPSARFATVTFAPRGAVLPPRDWGPRTSLSGAQPIACSLPSRCALALADSGIVRSFDPRQAKGVKLFRLLRDKRLGDKAALGSLACPSAKLCVAGGADLEQKGYELSGDSLVTVFDPRTGDAPR